MEEDCLTLEMSVPPLGSSRTTNPIKRHSPQEPGPSVTLLWTPQLPRHWKLTIRNL